MLFFIWWSRLRLEVVFIFCRFIVCAAILVYNQDSRCAVRFSPWIVPTKYRWLKPNILWLSSGQMHAPMIFTNIYIYKNEHACLYISSYMVCVFSQEIRQKRYHAHFISWLTYKFLGKCHKSLYDLTVSKSAWNEVKAHATYICCKESDKVRWTRDKGRKRDGGNERKRKREQANYILVKSIRIENHFQLCGRDEKERESRKKIACTS